MKIYIALCFLLVGASCAPIFNQQLDESWTLFKRVFKRNYASVEEENTRYVSSDLIMKITEIRF